MSIGPGSIYVNQTKGVSDSNGKFTTMILNPDKSEQYMTAQITAKCCNGWSDRIDVQATAKSLCDLQLVRNIMPAEVIGDLDVDCGYGSSCSTTNHAWSSTLDILTDYDGNKTCQGDLDAYVWAQEWPYEWAYLEVSQSASWSKYLLIIPNELDLYGKRIWISESAHTGIEGEYIGVGPQQCYTAYDVLFCEDTHDGWSRISTHATGHVTDQNGLTGNSFAFGCWGPKCEVNGPGEIERVDESLEYFRPQPEEPSWITKAYIGYPIRLSKNVNMLVMGDVDNYFIPGDPDKPFVSVDVNAHINTQLFGTIEIMNPLTDQPLDASKYSIIYCTADDIVE